MVEVEIKTADEMKAELLEELQDRQDRVNNSLPATVKGQLVKIEQMRFSEIAKEQLTEAIQLRIHRAHPTLVQSRESWELDRRKLLQEWGDRPTVYIEYICEGGRDDDQVIADLPRSFLNADGTLKEQKEDLSPASRDIFYEIEHNITEKKKRPFGFKDNGDGTFLLLCR